MNTKVQQLQPQFAQKLTSLVRQTIHELNFFVPDNSELKVELLKSPKQRMRSNASVENWSPYVGIRVYFDPVGPSSGAQAQPLVESPSSDKITNTPPRVRAAAELLTKPEQPVTASSLSTERSHFTESGLSEALDSLVVALDRAEATPGWSFVPLKKFRDEILPNHSSAPGGAAERQNDVREAIEKKLILVGKAANPKTPEFPVTTIRLNRMMPAVRRVLKQPETSALDFRPIAISGEPLSDTILRERR